MILNTGNRTDIPAYYSEWFYNRIRNGYVLVRNPYYPSQVTRYQLDPDVIDVLVFCTKNPAPMFNDFSLLSPFSMFWFVTITPYEKEIEPHVPDKEQVIDSFVQLSKMIGEEKISWRYDPIFISEKYSVNYHIEHFAYMASRLRSSTHQCVISFIDLYEKTKRNFPAARAVTTEQQLTLIDAFSKIAAKNDLQIHLCCENADLICQNVDADGCLSQKILEEAIECHLNVTKKKRTRQECSCLLGADIGAYNTCGHGCLYCYANYDQKIVQQNMAQHDKASPFIIGGPQEGDIIKDAKQVSWIDKQMNIFNIT